jgi:hypothetical protein
MDRRALLVSYTEDFESWRDVPEYDPTDDWCTEIEIVARQLKDRGWPTRTAYDCAEFQIGPCPEINEQTRDRT